jgi:CBS-domain-containing membrane protein
MTLNTKRAIIAKRPTSEMAKAKHLYELLQLQKELKEQVDTYKEELLTVMQQSDTLSLKTGSYTLTRANRITPDVVDFRQLKKSLEKARIPFMTEEVFAPQMTVVFREAIKENRALAGLEAKETEYVSIRLNEKKIK